MVTHPDSSATCCHRGKHVKTLPRIVWLTLTGVVVCAPVCRYNERLRSQLKPRPQVWRVFKPPSLLRYAPANSKAAVQHSMTGGPGGAGQKPKRRKMVMRNLLIEIGDVYESRLDASAERPESGKPVGT